jgi:hypothetical protein
MTDDTEKKPEVVEEIEVSGSSLLQKVKDLAEEGQVRRLRIIEPDGDIAVDVPLTVGAIAGGAVAIAAPALALIGVIAGLATRVKVQIVREPQKDSAGT